MLLNSILNSISIFYLLLSKMLKKLVRKMVAIQRNFLWGRVKGERKVCRVRWKTACLLHNKRGLGVRDLGLVNLSLLVKWRWRLLQSENALWKEVLEAKYGVNIINMGIESLRAVPYCASKWWKDIGSLEKIGLVVR